MTKRGLTAERLSRERQRQTETETETERQRDREREVATGKHSLNYQQSLGFITHVFAFETVFFTAHETMRGAAALKRWRGRHGLPLRPALPSILAPCDSRAHRTPPFLIVFLHFLCNVEGAASNVVAPTREAEDPQDIDHDEVAQPVGSGLADAISLDKAEVREIHG